MTKQVYVVNQRSAGVAFVLWALLGWAGIHRFYTGDYLYGLFLMFLCVISPFLLITIPLLILLWFIDLFRINGIIDRINRASLIKAQQLVGEKGVLDNSPTASASLEE